MRKNLSKKRGKKIDFIRTVNALYELRFFEDANELVPSKESVMAALGKVLGVNLSNYDTDLSQALSSGNVETNTNIFDQMSGVISKLVDERLMPNRH